MEPQTNQFTLTDNILTFNTSATIELREEEIEEFAEEVAANIGKGFMSMALLARFDSPFPRLPFEVITADQFAKEVAGVMSRAKIDSEAFFDRLASYDSAEVELAGPAQCDSSQCLNSK